MVDGSRLVQEVMNNMDGGVVAVGLGGEVIAFNRGAGQILGVEPESIIDQTFAEVFLPLAGLDAFTQAMLDAVHAETLPRKDIIEIVRDGETVSLSLITSYLDVDDAENRRRLGVVGIFTDISEIQALRAAELQLADTAKAQHAELQDAYLRVEESNQAVGAARKRERIIAGIVVVAILGIVQYAWSPDWIDFDSPPPAPMLPEGERTLVLQPERMQSSIDVTGQLAPSREVKITSPLTGVVADVHVRVGEEVSEGQLLFTLDATTLGTEYRSAQAAFIEAQQKLDELRDWSNSVEVARAQRALNRLKRDLDNKTRAVSEADFLLEQGIIAAQEAEAAEQQFHDLQSDYDEALRDLETLVAQGAGPELEMATLAFDNARALVESLRERLEQSQVRSPISGVVLPSGQATTGPGSSNRGQQAAAAGMVVGQGMALMTIGDTDTLSVTARVDEVDVTRVQVGQAVVVTGAAFPGIRLEGTISRVSSRAIISARGNANLPTFELTALVSADGMSHRDKLRLGMSADLRIVIYDRPDALIVPLDAVDCGRDICTAWVLRESGEVDQIDFEPGYTTVTSVEALTGLKAGDEILL